MGVVRAKFIEPMLLARTARLPEGDGRWLRCRSGSSILLSRIYSPNCFLASKT